jgi:DNA polymerase-3 subunit gamma/tau
VSKHRRAGSGRVTSAPSQEPTDLPTAGTSIVEVAVYGLLAAAVAGAVLVLGGQPRWMAGAVVLGALALVAVLLLASPRAAQQPGPSTGGRRGRRRRH